MKITLFTGGARSGKSRAALERAAELGGDAVSFLATGRAVDAEMADRIARHRAERPPSWETIEVAGDLAGDPAGALAGGLAGALAGARHDVVVLDCLTFLVSDALTGDALARSDAAVSELLEAAAGREGRLLVVTNEVGWGVVPATPLGRLFRDAQGRANQRVAEAAEEVVLLVSGIAVRVK